MFNFLSTRKKGKRSGEKGQALILVLCLIALGSLLLTAMLGLMGSGTKSSTTYHRETAELYSADAGIQDANWQIKYDKLTGFTNPSAYSPYDYNTVWQDTGVTSDNNVTPAVTIKNQWFIPTSIIPQPGAAEAQTISQQTQLIVNGTTSPGYLAHDGSTHISLYTLSISYNSASETTQHLNIDSIGVWIPQGCSYFSDGYSNSESTFQYLSPTSPFHLAPPTEILWANGTVENWDFPSNPQFTNFPNDLVNTPAKYTLTTTGTINILTAQFYFKPPQDNLNLKPIIIAWMKTTNGTSCGLSYNYAWNADIKLYKMSSFAKAPNNITGDGTTIEAYTTKTELRDLDSALNGDYYASGKSLMLNTFPVENHRDTLLQRSTEDFTTASTNIPDSAQVQLAYLYWSGWVGDAANGIWWDNCGNLTSTDSNYCKFNVTSCTWNIDVNSDTSNKYYERFKGQGNNATLTSKYNIDLSTNTLPAGDTAYLQWDQAISLAETQKFYDDTSASGDLTNNWTQTGSDWSFDSGSGGRYKALHTGGDNNTRYLTLKNAISLSSLGTTGNVRVHLDTTKSGSVGSSDGLSYQYSTDNGSTWLPSTPTSLFTGTPAANYDINLTNIAFTSTFKIRFQINGTSSTKYYYIDNVYIYATGQGSITFEVYNGITWSSPTTSLTGNNPPPAGGNWMPTYSYQIPTNCYNTQFQIKFILNGVAGANDWAYIDNLLITDGSVTAHEDRNVTFTIQRNDGSYAPVTTRLSANPATDMVWSDHCISGGVTQDGWYYACRVDVTDLVKNNSDGVNLLVTPKIYGNGKSTYTVGDVYAGNKCVMTPGELCTAAYAGWSLLIVYSSPDTTGHQLYLYENPTSVSSGGTGLHGSNQIDQTSSGFLVPAQITGEPSTADAGKITVFVGEGDMHNLDSTYNMEYVSYFPQGSSTDTKLWDGVDCSNFLVPPSTYYNFGNTSGNPNNPWNGFSGDSSHPTTANAMATESGIDVDTFHISWASGLLHEGDTSGKIRLSTNGDGFTLIYKIFSFRSKTTTGGSIGYLIKN